MRSRKDIASLFKRAVERYLETEQPGYKMGKYPISEKRLQKQFAMVLFDANVPFSTENYYRDRKKRIDFRLFNKKRIDFRLFNPEIEVEIEWAAHLTDGFREITFSDLDKLNDLEIGKWGMFLALNIGNKYERANAGASVTSHAEKFAKKLTVLSKKWKKAKETNLLKCNARFWRWRYDKKCDVTVLTCFGRRTHQGWKAT
jgi:hypothetical protein